MPEQKVTVEDIKALKGTRFPSLTAYDYGMAKLLDAAGMPLILVGDSLGMVVLGYPDTTHVTLEDIEHHTRAVARARPNALLVADLPYHTYQSVDDAVVSARRLRDAGAEAVKGEGGRDIDAQVRAIIADGIPFLGHLGMLPQRVKEEGGYKIKGKVEAERADLIADAKALEAAGAFGMILELLTPQAAREVTEAVSIPTIGIGSGSVCDGEILVITDLFGTSADFIPRHVPLKHDLAGRMTEIVSEWRTHISKSWKHE
ncbi:MAG: 3-methyl-2-oxobutanoate hydroxymethyltransferase [Verrucomicrobiales bacterium]|nr:3-methyl-2-oxobutanoate hydroxymethyltransferase [Verrucomicrobiales bacterium]